MQEILDLVEAPEPQHGAPELQPRIQEILDLVEAPEQVDTQRPKLVRGSAAAKAHARYMRACKDSKAAKAEQSVTPHVQSIIDRMHQRFAVRPRDRIDNVQAQRPVRVRGRGGHRRWTPEAILRCCFGAAGSCNSRQAF